MDSLSISNLIALDSLYMDRTHFTALKAEIRKNAQEKTAAFYKQQQSSDPYAREVVGEVEIFVDEENYIGAYFVTTGHTAFGTAYSYHACVNVILKGHLLNADYVALSPIPRKDIPRVVKKTAVGWINAILLANEH